jgi:D-alanyl-D-alanine carboxypeptidase (penicillin-binding protein 5/6)
MYRQPARTVAHRTRTTVYRARRRVLLGVLGLALVLALTAFGAARHPLNDKARVLNDKHHTYLSPNRWPQEGQAAVVLGNGRPAASPGEQSVPIASLAKVMAAYLTLTRYPLSGAQDGFTITVTAAQTQAEAQDAAEHQSVVAVGAGEQLTERQLLEALLIPSGNNIARMLAARVAGSETRFIAEMNAEARALGMDHTIYTDPSGFDPATVSTAADQLRVFQQAMRFQVFRQIVSMASVTLPVAGTLTNYNPLIAEGYAGKTGSDSAAGGCLAFFTHVTLGGRRLTAVGVVLGQGQGSDTSALLAAAGDAAQQLVDSVVQPSRVNTSRATGTAGEATMRCRQAGKARSLLVATCETAGQWRAAPASMPFQQTALRTCKHVSGGMPFASSKQEKRHGEPRGTRITHCHHVQQRPGGCCPGRRYPGCDRTAAADLSGRPRGWVRSQRRGRRRLAVITRCPAGRSRVDRRGRRADGDFCAGLRPRPDTR